MGLADRIKNYLEEKQRAEIAAAEQTRAEAEALKLATETQALDEKRKAYRFFTLFDRKMSIQKELLSVGQEVLEMEALEVCSHVDNESIPGNIGFVLAVNEQRWKTVQGRMGYQIGFGHFTSEDSVRTYSAIGITAEKTPDDLELKATAFFIIDTYRTPNHFNLKMLSTLTPEQIRPFTLVWDNTKASRASIDQQLTLLVSDNIGKYQTWVDNTSFNLRYGHRPR